MFPTTISDSRKANSRACVRSLFYRRELGLKIRGCQSYLEPQNPQLPIVLRASKSVGAKGDVPKIYAPAAHMLTHSLSSTSTSFKIERMRLNKRICSINFKCGRTSIKKHEHDFIKVYYVLGKICFFGPIVLYQSKPVAT